MGLTVHVGSLAPSPRTESPSASVNPDWGYPWPVNFALKAMWRMFVRPGTAEKVTAESVCAWRDQLAAKGRFQPSTNWDWQESPSIQGSWEKVGFDGYGAVQLWATYAGNPKATRPEEFPPDWTRDREFSKKSSTAFSHIIGAELWLPVDFRESFQDTDHRGRKVRIGSVLRLSQQLRQLNEATWNADEDAIRNWRDEDFDCDSLDSMARLGFSRFYCLTEEAMQQRLPMRVSY